MEKLRKSSYIISVKLKDTNDKYMLIHGYTGAIDIASHNLVSSLNKTPVFTASTSPFSKSTLEMLIKRGYVTNKSAKEERENVIQWANLLHKYNKNKQAGYMFLISYDCNFRCPYCYEGGISEDGRHWTKQVLTEQLVDRAYEAMIEIAPEEELRSKTITLYGGEPLMKENEDIVRYIITKGTELGYKFHAITNGHDLEYFEDLLGGSRIQFLQITLDGDREMHDTRRFHHLTGKSFDKIYDNIKLALDKKVRISIRFNADSHNFDHIKKLTQLFKDTKYSNYENFSFNAAMLTTDESLPSLKLEKSGIAYLTRKEFNRKYVDEGLNTIHQDYGSYERLYNAISQNKYLSFRPVFCGVQNNSYIFDPYGDIYSCWETVGIQKYVFGHYEKELTWTSEVAKWQQRNVGTTPKCSTCRYAFLCGGGCMIKALKRYGNYDSSFCDEYEDTFNETVNRVYNAWMTNQSKTTNL